MAPSVESRVKLLPTVPTTPMATDVQACASDSLFRNHGRPTGKTVFPSSCRRCPWPSRTDRSWLAAALRDFGSSSSFWQDRIQHCSTANAESPDSGQRPSLGLPWSCSSPGVPPSPPQTTDSLRLHRGTLRAGDRLDGEGDLLVLGDVTPEPPSPPLETSWFGGGCAA